MVTTKDLEGYFDGVFRDYLSTLSECSAYGEDKKLLVTSTKPAYNFDEIIQEFSTENFASVDSIFFSGKDVYFIEFKTGFQDRLESVYVPENFDCEMCNQLHKEIFEQFRKRREAEKDALHKVIQLKIVESLYFFRQCILPFCVEGEKEYSIKFICVIDEKEYPNTAFELSLNKLAKFEPRDELSKYIKKYGKVGHNHTKIFFEDVQVLTAGEFNNRKKFNK